MAELKNVMTFEQFSSQETEPVNEGLFTSLKTDINKFLKNPTDVKVADNILRNAFARTFNATATAWIKDEVLALPIEDKVTILTQAAKKLEDPKVGILKIHKTKNGWEVFGSGVVGGASKSVAG